MFKNQYEQRPEPTGANREVLNPVQMKVYSFLKEQKIRPSAGNLIEKKFIFFFQPERIFGKIKKISDRKKPPHLPLMPLERSSGAVIMPARGIGYY
ncbi:MAG: hypothetical protein J5I94_09030 [Phaeodactylibacter sp.]|nr:hypothetical protein [Phaeodactylibacter sp.]